MMNVHKNTSVSTMSAVASARVAVGTWAPNVSVEEKVASFAHAVNKGIVFG